MKIESRNAPHLRRILFIVAASSLCAVGANDLLSAAPRNADLVVLPSEVAPITAVVGNVTDTLEIGFTVQKSRPGAMSWAVSVDADWLELSTDGGILRPQEESATVMARVRDVSALPIGRYTGNVIFTATGNLPPVSRRVVLDVRLPAPVLLPEPAFTRGTTNPVAWMAVYGANQYEIQVSTTPQFASASSSGWMNYATNYLFTNLQPGVAYFYRVRCRSNHIAWSQTLGQEFAENDNSNISTLTSPGDVVLAGNTNRLWIEDFDEPGTNWADTIFDSSYVAPDPGFGRGEQDELTRAPDSHPALPINRGGDKEAYLRNGDWYHRYAYTEDIPENLDTEDIRDVTVDVYVGRSQGAGWIEAGVVLRGHPRQYWLSGGDGYSAQIVMDNSDHHWLRFGYLSNSIGFPMLWNPDVSFPVESSDANYHLRFSARGEEITARLWSVVATNGIIRESPVRFLGNGTNILSVQDSRYIRGVVGLTGVDSAGTHFDDDHAFFDDVTIQVHDFEPHYTRHGSSIAIVRRPSWVDHWGQLGWTGEIGPSTRLSVDVLDANGMILAADVASGTNLDSIPSVAHQQRLRLRANLSTADSRYTPTLSDWTVTFPEPVENPTASAWSGVVSSIPDVAPPVLAITSPEEGFVTLTNVVTVSGTAFDDISGVSNVRVLAGTVISTALTTNAFTNWTLTVAFPRRGTNQITVVAQDNAYPPNSTLLGQVVVLAE